MKALWSQAIILSAGIALSAAAFQSGSCGLSDDKFLQGEGSIAGQVKSKGKAYQGAEVTCVGCPPAGYKTVKTDKDGRFRLENLPVGKRDILIRAPEENMGFRGQARIVAGKVYDMKTVSLTDAPDLPILIKDPDIPVCRAKIGLKELPGVEAYTDFNGEATLPGVPGDGCYELRVLENENGFVFKSKQICFQNTGGPVKQISMVPEIGEPIYQAQLHNAYARLSSVLDDLTSCEGSCQVPDWWLETSGMPCCQGIMAGSDTMPVQEKYIEFVVKNINTSGASRQGIWKNIHCPNSLEMQSDCEQKKCRWRSSLDLDASRLLCHGGISSTQTSGDCNRNFTFASIDADQIVQKMSELDQCLDTSLCPETLEPLDERSIYVLILFNAYVDPPCDLELFVDNGGRCDLYFRCGLSPVSDKVINLIGSWFLYRFSFTSQPPNPGICAYDASIAWLDANHATCRFAISE